MDKEKFYVSLGTQEISRLKAGNNEDFIIYATPEDVIKLRELFDEMYDADFGSFWRAHVPIKEYHNDQENDDFDQGLINVLQMLYRLGDDQTREHIHSMNVLDNPDD
ncbi:hydrolase [Salinibacillus xinjiangensis]|uniref:Hydrolase n=1 Tax=Salinibacillus xinjiangensis TaxID=1229268 RepID=A0A6G1X2T8_9BACI|nr:hydrolase [Salinibacillus xinjiangensis]MRG85215.1 hydrolase [Salinibacillus xinjiangensis]